MFKQIRIYVLCCTILLVLFSCTHEHGSNSTSLDFNLEQIDTLFLDSPNNTSIIIQNQGEISQNIQFCINDKFWFTQQQMIDAIYSTETDTIIGLNHVINQTWTFVMQNTWHYKEIFLGKSYAFSPFYFINSIGGGLCSNRNAVLSNLWLEFNFLSRCVQLNGHLVAEVLDKGEWKMLDADFNRYYVNFENQVVGVDKLEDSIHYYNAKYDINVPNNQLYTIYKPTKYECLFTSESDNAIEDWYNKDILFKEEYLSLPAGASIELLVENPKDTVSAFAYGCLKIPKYYSGSIHMPFVVHHFENVDFLRSRTKILLQEKFNPPGDYYISGSEICLYFYVNPLLVQWESENIINIAKTNESLLEIYEKKSICQKKYSTFFIERNNQLDLLNSHRLFLEKYFKLKENNELFFKITSMKDISETIEIYLLKYKEFDLDRSLINQNLEFLAEYISGIGEKSASFFAIIQEPNYYYEIIWRILILQKADFERVIDDHSFLLEDYTN